MGAGKRVLPPSKLLKLPRRHSSLFEETQALLEDIQAPALWNLSTSTHSDYEEEHLCREKGGTVLVPVPSELPHGQYLSDEPTHHHHPTLPTPPNCHQPTRSSLESTLGQHILVRRPRVPLRSPANNLIGVSWASTEGDHAKTLDDIQVIRDWPGPARVDDLAWKTPSRIAYRTGNGPENVDELWGFGVMPKNRSYTWMKLLLDEIQASKYDGVELEISEGTGVLTLPPGKSAVDVCADYLAHVARFSMEHLERRLSPEVLEVTPLRICFTVPAVWSDGARSRTLQAAQIAAKKARLDWSAGIEIFMVPEPEAAAVAVLSTVTRGGSTVQVNVRPVGNGLLPGYLLTDAW